MTKALSTIVKGAGIVLAGFVVSKLLGYLYRVVVARLIGPSDYGILSIAGALLGIATTLAGIGLYKGILHFVAAFDSQNDDARVKGTIFAGIKIQLVSSLVFAAGLFLLAPWLAESYQIPQLEMLVRFFALSLPFAVLTSNLMMLPHAFRKIKYKMYVRNIFEILAKLFLVTPVVLLGFGLFGVAVAIAVATVLTFALSLYLIHKNVFRFFGNKIKPVYAYRQLLSFSWPLLAAGVFSVLMNTIDTIMLGYLSTAYNTGVYNVAIPTANFLVMPSYALDALFLPVITGLYAQKKLAEMEKTLKTVTRWLFSLVFPMALFSVLFAREIIVIMFGEAYATGAAALSILSLGMFLVAFTGLNSSVIESISKTKFILFNTVVCAILNIILNMLLIPIFAARGNAMLGAALATMTSSVLWALLALIEVWWKCKIHPYTKAYFRPMIAAIAVIALFFSIKGFLQGIYLFAFPINLLLLIMLGIVFVAVYACFFLVMRSLQPEDVELLRMAEKKAGFRVEFLRNIVKRFI